MLRFQIRVPAGREAAEKISAAQAKSKYVVSRLEGACACAGPVHLHALNNHINRIDPKY